MHHKMDLNKFPKLDEEEDHKEEPLIVEPVDQLVDHQLVDFLEEDVEDRDHLVQIPMT
jgi:hypothetical protein